MDTARSVVLVTCVISILSGILDAIKPDSRFDRQLRLLLSAVFVLSVLTQLAGGLKAFHPDLESIETVSPHLSDAVSAQTEAAAGANIEAVLCDVLTQGGVPDATVQAYMHTDEAGCIEIEQVTVHCADPETAYCLLTECLGGEVKIDVETAS